MTIPDVQSAVSAEIDPRTRRLLLPTRIIWGTEGDNAPRGAEVLLTSATSQATVAAGPRCVLPPGGAILLDFGQELHGGIQLVMGNTGHGGPVAVRLRFGESVSEAMGEPNQEHALHDHTVRLPRWGAYEVGNTGYRFVRIDVLEDCDIELIAVRAIELMRDLPYRGRFSCSDPQLNAIWQVAARTVHLCMQDYLWDGIKRDRLVWVGDMHPESQVISHLFGADPIVPRSLDYVRDETPSTGWMNGISSYTLWWVIIMHDWYRFHGDLGYLEENRGYLRELLPHICTQVDESGQEALSEWRFLDWGSVGQTEAIHAGL
ncbi:MAG: alpha-L-rhamnosidase, partial [bacterium]